MAHDVTSITIGVLALQGAFSEHIQLLQKAFIILDEDEKRNGPATVRITWQCTEIRTPKQLHSVDALIIPGGESTTIALVAARSGLLDPLRDFVKVKRKAVWGTCAGMILLAEAANRTKQNGQDLIGGLDVRVNRNHFGRQVESFETPIKLPFLESRESDREIVPFNGVFIRAPIVEKILPPKDDLQDEEAKKTDVVIAPSRKADENAPRWTTQSSVEIMATLPSRRRLENSAIHAELSSDDDIVAVRQGNVFGTSFHPELTDDPRIHVWWLRQVEAAIVGKGE